MANAAAEAGGRDGAFEAVFLSVLPRMVTQARESSAPARGFMAFGLLMYIAQLRAEGVTVTRAELARRLSKSQQMFSPHVDNLISLGLLTATKVLGGHGVGTQWHLDLVDTRIVEALRSLSLAKDGSAMSVEATAALGGASKVSALSPALAPRPRRRASRLAARNPA